MAAGRYHIVVDLVDVDALCSVDALHEFLKKLVGVIGMKILKGPEVVVGVPQNPGLTGFVIIDFSHISIHTFTDSRQACVDIFSCKSYEIKDAIDEILLFFESKESQVNLIKVKWG